MMYLYLTSVSLEIFLFLSRFYDLFFPFSSSGEKKKKKKKINEFSLQHCQLTSSKTKKIYLIYSISTSYK